MLDGEEVVIPQDFIEIQITAKEGFAVAVENNLFTILDTTITKELVYEGLAREMVSKVQQMRKQKDLDMMDRIKIYYHGDEEIDAAVAEHEDYIKKETLAEELVVKAGFEEFDLNGHKTGIEIEKLNN